MLKFIPKIEEDMKEIPEVTLQNYIKFNFKRFDSDFVKLFGSSIDSVAFNPRKDWFPDLFFTLKNGDEIPVEVEWKTSNFDHESHPDFAWFKNNKGLVMVGVLESDVNLGLEQIKIDLDKFEKWYVRNSQQLVKEELKGLRKLEKTKKRRQPKLWITLLTKKGGALKHFEPALEHETWGIQKNYKVATGKGTRLEEIQKDDLIVFLAGLHGSYRSKKTGKLVFGRYKMKEWSKPSFNGRFDYVCVFKVTKDYFESSNPKIWNTSPKGKWKNELFPHRFKFNRNPMLIMKDLNVRDLSAASKSELQNTVYVNFRMCDPDTLVDILHKATQINADKYDETLSEIPKIQ